MLSRVPATPIATHRIDQLRLDVGERCSGQSRNAILMAASLRGMEVTARGMGAPKKGLSGLEEPFMNSPTLRNALQQPSLAQNSVTSDSEEQMNNELAAWAGEERARLANVGKHDSFLVAFRAFDEVEGPVLCGQTEANVQLLGFDRGT